MGWETNERKIKLATGTYQVTLTHHSNNNNNKFQSQSWLKNTVDWPYCIRYTPNHEFNIFESLEIDIFSYILETDPLTFYFVSETLLVLQVAAKYRLFRVPDLSSFNTYRQASALSPIFVWLIIQFRFLTHASGVNRNAG